MVLNESSSSGGVGGTNRQDVLEREKAIGTFLAGDEMVRIIPSFDLSRQEEFLTLSQKLGPWTAGIPTTVPLWLAILLRKRCLCRIELPSWMSIDSLTSVLTEERNPQSSFSTTLPLRYMELSHSILSSSLEQEQPIRVLLEDISTVRMDKIRSNVHTMSKTQFSENKKPMDVITVNGIASHEIQTMKPFLSKAFSHHLHLALSPTTSTTNTSTTATTNTANTTSTTNTNNNPSTRSSRIRRFRS